MAIRLDMVHDMLDQKLFKPTKTAEDTVNTPVQKSLDAVVFESISELHPNASLSSFAGSIPGQWVMRSNGSKPYVYYTCSDLIGDVIFSGPADWIIIGTCTMQTHGWPAHPGIAFYLEYRKASDTLTWSFNSGTQNYQNVSAPESPVGVISDFASGKIIVRVSKEVPHGVFILQPNSFVLATAPRP
ncbi:hypothetical protein [Collimonas fungivorans]|uniref:hypothetical protein n=1 Tax=Collimonas fungivorans TaxID=158899 RepID=UPI003FA385CB